MKDLRFEAEDRDLEYIETTSAMNGYPQNIKGAIIGFDTFEQAQQLADELALEVQTFERRDGWQLWYRTGNNAYNAFVNSAEDFGDNYLEFPKIEEEVFVEQEMNEFDFSGFSCIEDYENFIKRQKEIWEAIDEMEDDEIVITNYGEYYETIKKESMYFSHDTRHYVIGLI